jgi:histidine triad (HIT) family protein
MAGEKTIFEKIAAREIPADIVYEDEAVIAFRDINPQAPVHVLIVPRKRIATIDDIQASDDALIGRLFRVASLVAAEQGLENGYRVVMNCGADGQQSVFHIHLHLLGGRKMNWPPG